MMKEASNILFPQFVFKERPHVLQKTIESWCDENRVEDISIESAKNLAIDLEVHTLSSIYNEAQILILKENHFRNCQ